MKIFTTAKKIFFITFLVGLTHLTVSAQSGNTLDFDGVNDYVDIPYNSTISNATLSVQLWVRVNTNTGNPQSIITSAASTINGGYKIYANPDGKFWLQVGNGGGTVSVEGAAISYGVWTNIAVTYDQSFVRFYVNGVLVKTVTVSGLGANPSPLPTRLGAGNTQGAANDFFGGQMHELSIWGKTLSQTEVSNNMVSSLSGKESGLFSYYNFNEGVGNGDNRTPPINTLNDLSSNHVNGTLYNFALIGTSSNWVTSSVVPVTLISFTGTNKKSSNLLTWATGSEQNSSLFEIQRSENGNDFSTLSTIAAAGNSDKLLNYQYEDHQLISATQYFYRLKMVDKDGSAKYSPIISVKRSATTSNASVFPNPARDQITISISDNSLMHTRASITDVNGRVLQNITLNQSNTPVNISQYIKGMYVVKFKDGSSVKIVKE